MTAWQQGKLQGLLAGLLLVLLTLPACQASRVPQPPPVPGAGRQFPGAKLTLYGLAPELREEDEQALIATFEKATGATIAVIPMAHQREDAYIELQRMSKAGKVDILTLDIIWPAAFAEQLAELEPPLREAAKAHFPAYLASGMHQGKLLAIPLYASVGMLYSRADLLSKYGFSHPPATWEELERMARVIQEGERRKEPGFTGFVWPGSPYEGLTCFGVELQYSHGGNCFLDFRTGKPNVTSPRAQAAFRQAQGWVGTISPSDVTSYTTPDALYVFDQGMAAFMRGWPTAYDVLASSTSLVRGKVSMSVLPHAAGPYPSAGALGGWMLGISKATKEPEVARHFVAYMTSPAVQAWRAKESGAPPTLPALYRDQAILAAQPHLRELEPIIQAGIARPSSVAGPRYPKVSQVYYQGLWAILRGSPVESVTPLMQRDLSGVLSR